MVWPGNRRHIPDTGGDPARWPVKECDMPEFYEISEFAKVFKIGVTKVYDEINRGRLRAQKLGRKTLIRRDAAIAWADALPALKVA